MTDTPKPKAKLLTLDALDGRSKNACFSLRKINSGLDSRQHVFSSVLGFPSESGYLLLTPLSFGDVSRNFRRTYNLTLGTSDWRHDHRNYDQPPIFALANRFITFDPFTAPNTFEDCKLFILSI